MRCQWIKPASEGYPLALNLWWLLLKTQGVEPLELINVLRLTVKREGETALGHIENKPETSSATVIDQAFGQFSSAIVEEILDTI